MDSEIWGNEGKILGRHHNFSGKTFDPLLERLGDLFVKYGFSRFGTFENFYKKVRNRQVKRFGTFEKF